MRVNGRGWQVAARAAGFLAGLSACLYAFPGLALAPWFPGTHPAAAWLPYGTAATMTLAVGVLLVARRQQERRPEPPGAAVQWHGEQRCAAAQAPSPQTAGNRPLAVACAEPLTAAGVEAVVQECTWVAALALVLLSLLTHEAPPGHRAFVAVAAGYNLVAAPLLARVYPRAHHPLCHLSFLTAATGLFLSGGPPGSAAGPAHSLPIPLLVLCPALAARLAGPAAGAGVLALGLATLAGTTAFAWTVAALLPTSTPAPEAQLVGAVETAVLVALLGTLGVHLAGQMHRTTRQWAQAYREVIAAVTRGRLILCDPEEVPRELAAAGCQVLAQMPVTEPTHLPAARQALLQLLSQREWPGQRRFHFALCLSEAATNALKHAGGAALTLAAARDGAIWAVVQDRGPGIDLRVLPWAALVGGYSTSQSLGMGFLLLLRYADQVLLATGAGGTTVAVRMRPDGERVSPCAPRKILVNGRE